MKILVTGVTGFIGAPLVRALRESAPKEPGGDRALEIVGISRRPPSRVSGEFVHQVMDIGPDTRWHQVLQGVDCVVHLADGLNAFEHLPVHAQSEQARQRVHSSLSLARAALECGVAKFIYLSSVKAMCGTWADHPLRESDTPRPDSLYGRLKLETEQSLAELAAGTGMQVTCLRFPLVFGDRADGNFIRLLRLADTGLPLPFKGISAPRSLISRDGLAHAIAAMVFAPTRHQGVYLVHQGALALPEILAVLRTGLNRKSRLFFLPGLAPLMVRLPGIASTARRLFSPLEVCDRRFRTDFSWQPPVSLEQNLAEVAARYRSSGRGSSGPVP